MTRISYSATFQIMVAGHATGSLSDSTVGGSRRCRGPGLAGESLVDAASQPARASESLSQQESASDHHTLNRDGCTTPLGGAGCCCQCFISKFSCYYALLFQ